MSRAYGIEEARKTLGDLVTAAQYGNPTIITRNGKPAAALVSISDIADALQHLHSTIRKTGTSIEPIRGGFARLAELIPEEPTMEHFTAWLTTDPTCLDQACADVVVLADELRGEPDDPNAWASTGDPLFTAATTVDAKDGDMEDAMREAVELLETAGWKLDGSWEAVSTGATVTVTRA